MLARLVAGMRDEDGRVLIPGFYDDVEPLSDAGRRALAQAPDIAAALRAELGLGRTEGGGKALDELITQPSLNIRGLAAAGVDGQSRNVIPTHATASIDVRLVKGMDHRRTMEKIAAHLRAQGYHVVDREPGRETRLKYPKICRLTRGSGYNAVRVPLDSPEAARIVAAVREARGDVILLPTLGGSLPIAPIAEVLRAPVIIVPIANHDNNQHGHNENIRLQNLWDGIETMAALLAM
jgi:acetylornithine deacetylase/succinyl-diaminopimelate desuccinylase-like protein